MWEGRKGEMKREGKKEESRKQEFKIWQVAGSYTVE